MYLHVIMSITRVHLILVLLFPLAKSSEEKVDVTVLTSAKPNTDVFQRFLRSSKIYNIDVKIIDQEESMPCEIEDGYCESDTMKKSVLLTIRNILDELGHKENKIVVIINSPNVIFNSGGKSVIEIFKNFESQVVFSADSTSCPIDESLRSKYPETIIGKTCLNSAGYVGYASVLYQIINENLKEHSGDDQLFFTKLYVNEDLRNKYKIKVDHASELFQTLDEEDEFKITYMGKNAYLTNKDNTIIPAIIIGSDSSLSLIDTVGDYVAKSYSPQDGCLQCKENNINLNNLNVEEFPTILMAIIISTPIPYFEEFLKFMNELDYPKSKLHLFIHLGHKYNQEEVEEYVNKHEKEYLSVNYGGWRANIKEWEAKTEAVKLCVEKKCDYYFYMNATVHLDEPNTLRYLIEQNRSVVTPKVACFVPGNHHPNILRNGIKKPAFDYEDVAFRKKKGLWTVTHLADVYLVNGKLLRSIDVDTMFYGSGLITDFAFCKHMRKHNVLLYATNVHRWGSIVSSANFTTSHLHNELHDINNIIPWQRRYLGKDYGKYAERLLKPQEPCPGVFLFPLFTSRFCSEFIEEMNHYGKWSGATEDERYLQGHATYPTDGLYLPQVGFDKDWIKGYSEYLAILRDRAFSNFQREPQLPISHTLRFTPDIMPSQDPQVDKSDYTVNIALNRQGIDYEGGGVHFFKDNCNVYNLTVGSALMYLGKMKHGVLKTTKGTRYILESLVQVGKRRK